jgi:hypothetical protein
LIQHIPGKENVVADALSRCLIGIDVSEKIKRRHNEVAGHHGVSKTVEPFEEVSIDYVVKSFGG